MKMLGGLRRLHPGEPYRSLWRIVLPCGDHELPGVEPNGETGSGTGIAGPGALAPQAGEAETT
jgi:hypothetical protein